MAARARIDQKKVELSKQTSPIMLKLAQQDLLQTRKDHQELKAKVQDKIANPPPKIAEVIEPEYGIEVFWYGWNLDFKFPLTGVTAMPYYGRKVRNSMNSFGPVSDSSYNPYGVLNNMCMKIRANLLSNTSMMKRITVRSDDGIYINVGKLNVLNKFYNGQVDTATNVFMTDSLTPTPIDIYWFQNTGSASFNLQISQQTVSSVADFGPKELKLRVPSEFPVARWDFYMSMNERNGVLQSTANELTSGYMNNKRCAIFNGTKSNVSILNTD
jgi:hypothetical protein